MKKKSNKLREIYLVVSSYGEWEDYCETIERAFVDENCALEYAKKLDEEHHMEPIIEKWLWDEVCGEVDGYLEEHEDILNHELKYGEEGYIKQELKNVVIENNLLLETLNKFDRSRTWTMEDIKKQQEYDDLQDYDYYPCKVQKIMLDETFEGD